MPPPASRPTASATLRAPTGRTLGRSGTRMRGPLRDRPTGTSRCRRSGRTCAPSSACRSSAAACRSRNSTPRPQSFGSKRPTSGRTPPRPGNCTDVASARVSGATSARRLELAGECESVVERAVDVRGRRASQLGAHAERLEHRGAEVLLERHLRRTRDRLREQLEAGVGVDAPLAGLRDRRRVRRTGGRTRARAGGARWTRRGRPARRGRSCLPPPRRAPRAQ